jgi:hypothetical protein
VQSIALDIATATYDLDHRKGRRKAVVCVEALDAAHAAFWKPDLIWNSWGDALAPLMVPTVS